MRRRKLRGFPPPGAEKGHFSRSAQLRLLAGTAPRWRSGTAPSRRVPMEGAPCTQAAGGRGAHSRCAPVVRPVSSRRSHRAPWRHRAAREAGRTCRPSGRAALATTIDGDRLSPRPAPRRTNPLKHPDRASIVRGGASQQLGGSSGAAQRAAPGMRPFTRPKLGRS